MWKSLNIRNRLETNMIHNLDTNCPTSGHSVLSCGHKLWHHKKQYIPSTSTFLYISIKNFHYILFYLPN